MDAGELEELSAHESPTRQKYSRSIVRLLCFTLRTYLLRQADPQPSHEPLNQAEDSSGPPESVQEEFREEDDDLDEPEDEEEEEDYTNATSDLGARERATKGE